MSEEKKTTPVDLSGIDPVARRALLVRVLTQVLYQHRFDFDTVECTLAEKLNVSRAEILDACRHLAMLKLLVLRDTTVWRLSPTAASIVNGWQRPNASGADRLIGLAELAYAQAASLFEERDAVRTVASLFGASAPIDPYAGKDSRVYQAPAPPVTYKVGDPCPTCGQKLETFFFNDSEYTEIYKMQQPAPYVICQRCHRSYSTGEEGVAVEAPMQEPMQSSTPHIAMTARVLAIMLLKAPTMNLSARTVRMHLRVANLDVEAAVVASHLCDLTCLGLIDVLVMDAHDLRAPEDCPRRLSTKCRRLAALWGDNFSNTTSFGAHVVAARLLGVPDHLAFAGWHMRKDPAPGWMPRPGFPANPIPTLPTDAAQIPAAPPEPSCLCDERGEKGRVCPLHHQCPTPAAARTTMTFYTEGEDAGVRFTEAVAAFRGAGVQLVEKHPMAGNGKSPVAVYLVSTIEAGLMREIERLVNENTQALRLERNAREELAERDEGEKASFTEADTRQTLKRCERVGCLHAFDRHEQWKCEVPGCACRRFVEPIS